MDTTFWQEVVSPYLLLLYRTRFNLCTAPILMPQDYTTVKTASTPWEMIRTATPAMQTPIPMAGTAAYSRRPSMAATSAPVHAPVPGRGMATRMSRPSSSYL